MNRQDAERITLEYLKPIFGFTLKRCKNVHDSEDLSQEIVLKVFRALISRDDIIDTEKFIWTVAHNALSNYYRDSAQSIVGIYVDEIAETMPDPAAQISADNDAEAIHRIQSEIAYLSKLQRRIVIAYYFENRKQADIAKELSIPLGTVKWHLFEAKKELKRGMHTMRNPSELKFNPIKFHSYGVNGSVGTKHPHEFFRSILSQNICYCVRNTAKTIHEIADALGVSPVYVEAEAEFLEEYGFLQAQKDKYIVNFIIDEPTAELLTLQNDMYKKAAELYANALYDELIASGVLNDTDIGCNQTDGPVTLNRSRHTDHNFLLWSLIPYIAAWSGKKWMDDRIQFTEVATIRPDGGHNIFHASVVPDEMRFPDDYVYMKKWCGPMWNGNGEHILWQIDSEWSDRVEHHGFQYSENARRVLSLYKRETEEGILSKDEYAWLAERGYIKTNGDYDGRFHAVWQIVILANKEIKEKLLAIGERIKANYKDEFDSIKAPYVKAVLNSAPTHLRKVRQYELQSVFYSDGYFLLHCMHALLKNGKIKAPTQDQKKSVSTLITFA